MHRWGHKVIRDSEEDSFARLRSMYAKVGVAGCRYLVPPLAGYQYERGPGVKRKVHANRIEYVSIQVASAEFGVPPLGGLGIRHLAPPKGGTPNQSAVAATTTPARLPRRGPRLLCRRTPHELPGDR